MLWPIVLTEGFLAFGTASFHTKFSDFCALLPIFAVVFVSFVNCHIFLNNLTETSFTTFETEYNFCFHNIWFEGLRHRSLAEIGRVFSF